MSYAIFLLTGVYGFVIWLAYMWWAAGRKEDPNQPEDGVRIALEDTWLLKCAWLVPCAGTVVGRVRARNGRQWALLRLDSPAVDPLGVIHTHVLLRSRYAESVVGGPHPTQAMVLQAPDPANIGPGFEVWKVDIVAFAWAKRESEIGREQTRVEVTSGD